MTSGLAKRPKICAQVDRGANTNKEQRIVIITRMAPGIFDGKACFADTSQSMNRLVSCETNRSPLPAHESLPELYKRGVATFKERAEGEL